ncbi:MAG: hypothetical protein ACPGYT_01235 [Nitrospirales bacterium]
MLNPFAILLLTIAIIGFTWPSQAEIHLQQDRLTINAQETTVQEVLNMLAKQGQFDIMALEESTIKNVRISKKFWNLPVEECLARIFSGWNYGMSRDQQTGKIITLFLVSQKNRLLPQTVDSHAKHWPGEYARTSNERQISKQDTAPFEHDDKDEEEWESSSPE